MNFDRWRNTEKERERVLLARSIYIYTAQVFIMIIITIIITIVINK